MAANVMSEREKNDNRNHLAYLVGSYYIYARAALSGKGTYPKEPIKPQPKLTPEQEKKQQEMQDAIIDHNIQMRKIKEQQAAKFQQDIIAQLEANSHGK